MKKFDHITKNTQRAKEFFENKMAYTLGPVELDYVIKNHSDKIQIFDVRKKEDYEKGHIENAISVPAAEVKDNLDKFSKEKVNILYCYNQQCHAAAGSAVVLAENGYPVMELSGGSKKWVKFGYPMV